MNRQEFYCRETMTTVENNKMRPGYDCRCSGCMAFVQAKLAQGQNVLRLP